MNKAVVSSVAMVAFLVPTAMVGSWVHSAGARLAESQANAASTAANAPKVAVASAADESYCTPQLKVILRRVLKSCGLLDSGEVRGCQPTDAKQIATLAGGDFNALFKPMAKRAGVVEYDQDSAVLDASDTALIDKIFSDQQGATYFFVVARASPEGSVEHNRELSKQRAEALLQYLREKYKDPDLNQEVGLLWLGEEVAQLDPSFCDWQRSGTTGACSGENLNRSAFISWIDCQL
jgi:outer membrane protein OmpA-like peptidoglycan-associated protein